LVNDNRRFADKASGAKDNRLGPKACLAYLCEGHCLTVWKLDRLVRSLPHLLAIVSKLKGSGIVLHSLTEQMDTTTPHGELLFSTFRTLAQYERAQALEQVWRPPSVEACKQP
jgi:DNA invertase Pin-like site-specific DNA recombinase